MTQVNRKKGFVKLFFWLLVAVGLISYIAYAYTSGQMIRWYYYSASVEGYAINADSFADATKDKPAILTIVEGDKIEGPQAVRVRPSARLPENTNGVISFAELELAKRVSMDIGAGTIKVAVPYQIKEEKGFKYKDTFKHKGIRTNPWSGLWNVVMILLLGLALGLFAEAVTDVLGVKIEKIEHGH